MLRTLLRPLAFALALLTAGCIPVMVYQQATPNPLKNQRTFVLLPLDFTRLTVLGQPEEDYLQSTPALRQRWERDKTAAARNFADLFAAHATGLQIVPGTAATRGAFVVQPLVTNMEVIGADTATTMQVTVRIVDPAGKLVDEISVNNGSSFGDWSDLARRLGTNAARYLLARTAGQAPFSTDL